MEAFLFFLLAFLSLFTALAILFSKNPIYSALSLSGNMICLAFLFFLLKSFFIGAVQLIVYAGAVMILFLMIVMLFNLKKETQIFSDFKKIKPLIFLSVGAFLGIFAGLVKFFISFKPVTENLEALEIKDISIDLFTKHIFPFEVIGVLLLVVAIGAVVLARMKEDVK